MLGKYGARDDYNLNTRRDYDHNSSASRPLDHDNHGGNRIRDHNDHDQPTGLDHYDNGRPNHDRRARNNRSTHIIDHIDHHCADDNHRSDNDHRSDNHGTSDNDSPDHHGRPVIAASRTITAMPYEIDPDELAKLLPPALADEPSYRTDQLRRWLYTTPVLTPAEMTNLPATFREFLGESHWPFVVEAELSADQGATRKWLLRAHDGASIETVMMGYQKRTTICISSQAGCAMACTFCATGQFGFERHLTAGEIVAQVAYANASLRHDPMTVGRNRVTSRVTNIVFMGMGEPLANYGNVRESIRRMVDVMEISPRHITVSTVGIAPAIHRLAEEPWPLNLAVSLHAADDETRSSIVPINRRYPIHALTEACAVYFEKTGRRVSIEWTLIADKNDSIDQAQRLGAIAAGMSAHVNVIPLNPTPLSADLPPDEDSVHRFKKTVEQSGVTVTIRNTRGRNIDAACGQLRSQAAIPG